MWIDTEGAIHRNAKIAVCEHLNKRDQGKAYYLMEYPILLNTCANSVKICPLSWRGGKVPTFTECVEKKQYPKKVIDIVGVRSGSNEPFIFIEICDTHPVDEEKLKTLKYCLELSYRSSNIKIVEIQADWVLSAPLPTRLGGELLHPYRKTILPTA